MQKLFNVLALSSFVVSAAVVGGGAYVYLNKDAMIENAKEKVAKQQQKQLLVHSLVCWMQQCQNFLTQLAVLCLVVLVCQNAWSLMPRNMIIRR